MKDYTEKTLERFKNPQHMGKIEDADGVGEVGNPKCGDLMTIYITVEDNHIKQMKFKTLGCAAAIATSDIVCELAQDKSLAEAKEITFQDVVDDLGSLPSTKVHCADLANRGLEAAIEDYEQNQ